MDKAKKYLGELLEAIIIVAVLYTVFFPARVDGNSMENTLNDGDTIFVSRAAAFAGLYKNDDIIVFEHKKGNKNGKPPKKQNDLSEKGWIMRKTEK